MYFKIFPDGYDIEIFDFLNLYPLPHKNAKSLYDKEHVTSYMLKSKKLKKRNYSNSPNLYFLRCTLDDINDLKFIRKIYRLFAPKIYFGYEDFKKLFYKQPNFFYYKMEINNYKTWLKALKVIPGGNMLMSKRPPESLIKNIQFIFLNVKVLIFGI